jgi:hypothetical protein
MVSKLFTYALYLLLISTFVQTKSPLRLNLDYLKEKALETIDLLQNEHKFLQNENAERSIPDLSAVLSMLEQAIQVDKTSDPKEINEKNTEEVARVNLAQKLDSNDEIKKDEKEGQNKRESLSGVGDSSTGGEILHIIVLIVIILVGIGAIIAIIALIAFLINYIKRRMNIKGGKRPGSEHILLLDNSHSHSHLPTRGSV